ncbi:hypothetical protein ABIB57_000561 [Devosia sp. UYZn731]|uniref:hypothetical protein n=1 Tax=Devosia sp. UYZn731 TaxID=3156345 RepID=UPI003399922A
MFMRSVALAAVIIGFAAAPAFAAAVTYAGTRGDQNIILELTEPEDGPVLGRYTQLSDGADVPLHFVALGKDGFELAEEKRCTPQICVVPEDGDYSAAPLGAHWILHYAADRSTLTGFWHAEPPGAAVVAVTLKRVGQRVYDREDGFSYDYFLWNDYDGAPITPETTPYDYAKMQVALTEGPLQTMNGATYRDVVDPRTKFTFPRVVSLPGGGDIAPVNTMLDQQRWATSFVGLQCLGQDYLSGGWDTRRVGNGYSPLGDVDQEGISVDYISDTVMSISQGGSLYCGGASPHNHIDYYTYDVRAGGALDLSRILKDWDAASNDPTQALADWVIAAYPKTSDYDADYAAECEINENIAKHLDISFASDDTAVFLIGGIDQAACMGAIVTMPLAQIRDLLTDTASDYFPSLNA